MAEYIDREATVGLLENKYQDMSAMPASYYAGFQYALNMLKQISSAADVQQVVRCKDCIWRGREECAMFYRCECGEQHTWETDNDFCSYGERKEPDNERPNRNR